ncbi:hypothetical protein NQ318_004581 [Aromia moschata]|uniref:Uncharacterized protein n=1 Tax=Aromia moschata TaxID=1265417 RepID=A0AAV8X8K8_9CUCU|nr:hypothetical protein NQ318_004581 [Aromia moschata]
MTILAKTKSTKSNITISINTFIDSIRNPHSSIRRSAQQHEISKGFIGNIIKRNKFYPYKVKLVHELIEDDLDRQIEFCDDEDDR